jgi:hypothetical protein
MGFDPGRWDLAGGRLELPRLAVYPGTGMASLRSDWSKNAMYCLLDFSQRFGGGGHWHGGKLGISLCVGQQPFLVDPGCGDYCLSEFEELRQPGVHSSLLVDGAGDSATRAGRPWTWVDSPQCMVLEQGTRGGVEFVAVESVWPARHCPVCHGRAVALVDRRFFVIADRAECSGEHEFSLPLHFAPEVRVELTADSSAILARGPAEAIQIVPLADPPLRAAVCPGKVFRHGAFLRSLIVHRWTVASDSIQASAAFFPIGRGRETTADDTARAMEVSRMLLELLGRDRP